METPQIQEREPASAFTYEAAFARAPTGKLTLLGVRRYWFDFAGLEAIAHWLGALGGGLIGVACSLVYLFGWLPTRKAA